MTSDWRKQNLSRRLLALYGKLVDNFSPESDVTSLQDPFTSRPYKPLSNSTIVFPVKSEVRYADLLARGNRSTDCNRLGGWGTDQQIEQIESARLTRRLEKRTTKSRFFWIFWRLVNFASRWSWPIGFYGGGNALVVPVFNIRALVMPTVSF